METAMVSTKSLNWLMEHCTLTPNELSARCRGMVPIDRLNAILKTGNAFRTEVDAIATALNVAPLVLLDMSGVALPEHAEFLRLAEKEGDVGSPAFEFTKWAVEKSYAARNSTGLPLTPDDRMALYRQYQRR